MDFFSPQEQRILPQPLVQEFRIRGQEGSAGPGEDEADREGPQRRQTYDQPGRSTIHYTSKDFEGLD